MSDFGINIPSNKFLVKHTQSVVTGVPQVSDMFPFFNRPSAAGAVLQTPLSLGDSVTHPFPPNLQNPCTMCSARPNLNS